MNVERFKEIIGIANKIGWVLPVRDLAFRMGTSAIRPSYPLMQLSEVEKCMVAMYDDFELNRLREWARDEDEKKALKFTLPTQGA